MLGVGVTMRGVGVTAAAATAAAVSGAAAAARAGEARALRRSGAETMLGESVAILAGVGVTAAAVVAATRATNVVAAAARLDAVHRRLRPARLPAAANAHQIVDNAHPFRRKTAAAETVPARQVAALARHR